MVVSAEHMRRRWKRYLSIGVPVLALAVMLYTGFVADIGMAILTRMPAIASVYMVSEHEPHYGPASLEERVVGSDVIARVRLRSVSQTVEFHDYTVGETAYARALEFSFDVLEYLKGSGGDRLVAVAYDLDLPFNTSQGATLLGEDFLGGRDTQWDDREAIVFLTNNHPSLPSTSRADRYWFGHLRFNHQDRYTLASDELQLWLPAASPGGAAGSSGGAQLFLTDVPSSAGGRAGASGQTAEAPTISLSEMKSQIAELDREVNAGDGSREYRECIYHKYEWERRVRYETDRLGGEYYHGQKDHDVRSALPSGSEVFAYEYGGYYVESYGDSIPSKYAGMFWLEGRDKDLFSVRYPGIVSVVRPLIQGEYRFYFNGVPKEYIICDAMPEAERKRDERLIRVTAPARTVHEAFFDPVAVGTAVGSDDSNGVLDPASFTLEGIGTVNINRVEWESGIVRVELAPHGHLTGHHIDFIGADGWLFLRLDFDDAVEVNQNGTRVLSWKVCTQPWKNGDLLMLRISESPTDLKGVTDDTSCPPPAPQDLSATSTHNSVTLTWDAPEDPSVTAHRIARRVVGQSTFTRFEVAGATTTTYIDTSDIHPAVQYIYRVNAVNDAGISRVATTTVTALAPPPQSLSATSTHDSVTLTWDAADGASPAGYRVLRRQPSQDTFIEVELAADVTSYTDTRDVQPATRYIYRVHSVYPAGLSRAMRVEVTALAAP